MLLSPAEYCPYTSFS